MKWAYSCHEFAAMVTLETPEKPMNIPTLPPKPTELTEIEARCRAIRGERQAVEAELQRIQVESWRAAQGNENLERAASAMASGETDATSRDMTPERIEELSSRLEILTLADRKASGRAAEWRERHARNIAKAFRPAHRAAVRRIAVALTELVAANTAEEELRARVPGGKIRPANFPNCGRFGPHGDPCQLWKNYVKREGLLDQDEPETTWPVAAL
jgi:hypothetical protein